MLQIKLKVSGFFLRDGCVLCGRGFTYDGIENILYEDDVEIGHVCGFCMEVGSKNFPSVLRAHAENLRKSAEELEKMAGEGIAFPTDEEIEIAVKQREERDSDVSEETKQWCDKFNASCETWFEKASKLIKSRET